MKCDFCRQREAILHITTGGGRSANICLSSECADKVADYIGAKAGDTILSYTTINKVSDAKPVEGQGKASGSKGEHHRESKPATAPVQASGQSRKATKVIRLRPGMPDASKFPVVVPKAN